MKNAILINAYPMGDIKENILKEQISNLKKLQLPIILCSGCDTKQDIINSVDYFILNKEKILKPISYQKKAFKMNKRYVACFYWRVVNKNIAVFEDNVDPTIAKNTRLLFETAKKFRFENVIYTEDDTIINNIDYYKENLNILNIASSQIKMCIPKCNIEPMMFTNHYFSNIDFFLENFRVPQSLDELYDEKNFVELEPFQIYERVFYKSFKSNENKIHFIPTLYAAELINKSYLFNRRDNIDFVMKNDFSFCLGEDQKVSLFGFNYYKEELYIKIKINNCLVKELNLVRGGWCLLDDINVGDSINIELLDKNGNLYTHTKVFLGEEDISSWFFV